MHFIEANEDLNSNFVQISDIYIAIFAQHNYTKDEQGGVGFFIELYFTELETLLGEHT